MPKPKEVPKIPVIEVPEDTEIKSPGAETASEVLAPFGAVASEKGDLEDLAEIDKEEKEVEKPEPETELWEVVLDNEEADTEKARAVIDAFKAEQILWDEYLASAKTVSWNDFVIFRRTNRDQLLEKERITRITQQSFAQNEPMTKEDKRRTWFTRLMEKKAYYQQQKSLQRYYKEQKNKSWQQEEHKSKKRGWGNLEWDQASKDKSWQWQDSQAGWQEGGWSKEQTENTEKPPETIEEAIEKEPEINNETLMTWVMSKLRRTSTSASSTRPAEASDSQA